MLYSNKKLYKLHRKMQADYELKLQKNSLNL